jgi:integrase
MLIALLSQKETIFARGWTNSMNYSQAVPQKGKRPYALPKKPVPDVISTPELCEVMLEYDLEWVRGLFAVLLLSGGRISEVLELRKKDIIFTEEKGTPVLKFRLNTRKNRRVRNREVFSIGDTREKREMFKAIENWVATVESVEDRIFAEPLRETMKPKDKMRVARRHLGSVRVNIRMSTPEGKVMDAAPFRIHPHYLRHCWLTHLNDYPFLSEYDKALMAGHTDLRYIMRYTHATPQTTLRKMLVR